MTERIGSVCFVVWLTSWIAMCWAGYIGSAWCWALMIVWGVSMAGMMVFGSPAADRDIH